MSQHRISVDHTARYPLFVPVLLSHCSVVASKRQSVWIIFTAILSSSGVLEAGATAASKTIDWKSFHRFLSQIRVFSLHGVYLLLLLCVCAVPCHLLQRHAIKCVYPVVTPSFDRESLTAFTFFLFFPLEVKHFLLLSLSLSCSKCSTFHPEIDGVI